MPNFKIGDQVLISTRKGFQMVVSEITSTTKAGITRNLITCVYFDTVNHEYVEKEFYEEILVKIAP